MKKNFYESETLVKPVHGGSGIAENVKLFGEEELSSDLKLVTYIKLEPGATIGYHVHEEPREEVYTIFEGRGTMKIDEKSFEVKKGDVILTPPGSGHGLVNSGEEPMNIFVFWVKVRD